MGNGASISINLHRELGASETSPATAGTALRGKVVVELKYSLKVQSCETVKESSDLGLVTFRIYGKEKVRMKLGAAQKRARKQGHKNALSSEYPYPRTAERLFFDVNLPLKPFAQSSYDAKRHCILPGTYKFPFEIQLPAVLPSSTSFNPYTRTQHSTSRTLTGKKPGFRIQYKMFVIMNSGSASEIKSSPQHLWISSSPKTSIHSEPVPSMVLPLPDKTSQGFWSQGSVLTAAYLEDSIVSRSDDHVNLHIACRNNSRSGIDRVQLHLVETIRWGTVATNGDANDTILQEESNLALFGIKDIELPSLEKNRVTLLQSMSQSIFGSKNKQERDMLRSIHEDLKSEQSKLSITLPLQSLARDSYSGQLVQVSHHIEIHFRTNDRKQAGNPHILIPIRMVNGDRHSIEATGSFCNSITESEQEEQENEVPPWLPAHAIAIETDHIDSRLTTNPKIFHDNQDQEIKIIYSNIESYPESQIYEASGKPVTANDKTQIPIAVASVATNGITLGGDTGLFYQHSQKGLLVTPLSELVPLALPTQEDESMLTPSLPLLLSEMRASIDAYSTIRRKLEIPQWLEFFGNSSPYEFGIIVSHVYDPFEQPRVAYLLGQYVNRGRNIDVSSSNTSGLTCEYIAFAIRNTSDTHRSATARGLLRICIDAAGNHGLVLAELSEWDQTVVLSDLETAIAETMPVAGRGKLKPLLTKKKGAIKTLKAAVPC